MDSDVYKLVIFLSQPVNLFTVNHLEILLSVDLDTMVFNSKDLLGQSEDNRLVTNVY